MCIVDDHVPCHNVQKSVNGVNQDPFSGPFAEHCVEEIVSETMGMNRNGGEMARLRG